MQDESLIDFSFEHLKEIISARAKQKLAESESSAKATESEPVESTVETETQQET